MDQFSIEPFQKITGIGSASGLIYKDNSLFIISDNSSFLYQYHILENQLSKIKLLENSQENIPKKDKFDFESIAIKGNKLHLLGSGSTSKRKKRFTYDLETKETAEKDLSKLYKKLKLTTSIPEDELNVEGSLYFNQKWHLFQRGNGGNSSSGVAILDDNFNDKGTIEFIPFLLPRISELETSFTDAVFVDDKIYFLAAAENTTSTYDDGEIFGSILGQMNSQTFEIEFTQIISNIHKFEGLTLYKKTETEIQFLICEDNDTPILETTIYKLTFNIEQNERLEK